MKRVGCCKILAKYGENAYKVDLPSNLRISPIFNVQDLMAFKGTLPHINIDFWDDIEPTASPKVSKLEVEKVLDSRVKKSTRHKVYLEYLIQWKAKPIFEAIWVAKI